MPHMTLVSEQRGFVFQPLDYNTILDGMFFFFFACFVFCLEREKAYASEASAVTRAAHSGTSRLWCFLAHFRLRSRTHLLFYVISKFYPQK